MSSELKLRPNPTASADFFKASEAPASFLTVVI